MVILYKEKMKYLIVAVLLAGCSAPTAPVEDKEPIVIAQDLESCTRQPDLPWCLSECKKSDREWC
jgi:PBP1b-binding outer membrane lipoprotein LpoB